MRRIAILSSCLMLACLTGARAQDSAFDIIVLGEMHDNPDHHQVQAAWVSDYPPTALVFEMLFPAQAANAAGISRSDMQALDSALGWTESGLPAFDMYFPIFAAAPEVPLFGAALPREDVMRAAAEGAAKVFGAQAVQYGLVPLPADEQAVREAEQMANHCDALPVDAMPGMVEAQRLRDAHFAKVALEAFDMHGGPVVVITGNEHARNDRGIPNAIALARPELRVFSVGQFEAEPEDAQPFDGYFIAAPVARGDPCEAFR